MYQSRLTLNTCFMQIRASVIPKSNQNELNLPQIQHASRNILQKLSCYCQLRGFHRSSNKQLLHDRGFLLHTGNNRMVQKIGTLSISKRYCSSCTFRDKNVPFFFRLEPPWRILFMGTDEFSVETLKALNEARLRENHNLIESLDVVALKLRKPCAVRKYAVENGLAVSDWPSVDQHKAYDVGVVSSFGRLIPEKIIHMFPYGILNVHPSLLPRWRGCSPIVNTILNNDSVTGVTITEIRPKHFDIGPILVSEGMSITPKVTRSQLEKTLAIRGGHLLVEVLSDLQRLERFEHEQDSSGITYAHKIHSDVAKINWDSSMEELFRKYRALHGLMDLKSEYLGKTIRFKDMVDVDEIAGQISQIEEHDGGENRPPGYAHYIPWSKTLCVKCGDGWVGFKTVLYKKTLPAIEFKNGYLAVDKSGSSFNGKPDKLKKAYAN